MPTDTGGGPCGAGGEQQYSLRWNDFHSAMVSSFRRLRDEEDFVDVTLACAGATFSAHKVVLSACSPYFRRLLKANPCQHPIVILRDVHDKDMESLLRFMYQGEVHIGQEQLKEFLKAAQLLQVRGLTDVPAHGPITTIDQKASPVSLTPSASSWTETGSGGSRDGRDVQREGRRSRKPDDGAANTPPPKRARSSDLYQAQLKTRFRTEQLLTAQGASPERLGTNGHEHSLFGQGMDTSQNQHLSGISNNLSGDGEESSSDAGVSDTEPEPPRAKQEPIDYDDPATMAGVNGNLPHNFPGLLNLPGFAGLPGPSTGLADNYGNCRRTQDLLRVRATDPRPCPKCGKIYRSAHTLRTHLEDKHTVCPGYRCVLCGTVAKSRNSLHSHMSRQHRGISTKDLPVLQMPTRFDPELASQLLAKAGVKVSPEQLRARASPTGPRRSDMKLDAKSAASESSSICGDNDNDDLSRSRYEDSIPVSPPHINNLANTTITKVPAIRAVTAKTIADLPHGLAAGLKHEDYPAGYGGSSALLDTYLQYIGENMLGMNAKLAQMNAMHMDRKTYDERSPQMGSLPPPPTNLAHQRFLKQMQRQYTDNMGKPDIMRDSDEPLDLGKERQRNDSIGETDADKHGEKDNGKDYYNDDDRNRLNSEQDPEMSGIDDGEFSDDEQKNSS